jgi:ribosomal protein S18 acetylase RimI-like enzyme
MSIEAMIEIMPMSPDQWQLYKTVRSAALANAPHAFSSTLEDALKRSDDDWAEITNQFSSNPNSITYFAFENEDPCGMAACAVDGNEAEMFAVWVDPGCRRKGVGRQLIEFAIAWSKMKGTGQLNVGVFDDNSEALAFYRSAGFEDSGKIKPELSSEKRTVILLTMDLLKAARLR